MEIGHKVPDFTLPATTGEPLTLSQVCAAHKGVVLTTFPLAFTGAWQTQLTAFKAQVPQFEALGFQVIGLSIDSKFSQKAFAEKLELNFPLVADANRDASPQLGTMLQEVAGIRNVNMRSAMLIDSGMTLRWKFGVDAATQPNVEQVLGEVRRLMGNA